jgi:4-carboxymuconolactone decarboxylase
MALMSNAGKPCRKETDVANIYEHNAMDDLKAIAPEFAKLTQEFLFDDMWKRPELSQRDKSLITVTCLVALNRIEQVDIHLKKALENGITREELVAAITHITFYAGWPAAVSGFAHLKKVIDQQ